MFFHQHFQMVLHNNLTPLIELVVFLDFVQLSTKRPMILLQYSMYAFHQPNGPLWGLQKPQPHNVLISANLPSSGSTGGGRCRGGRGGSGGVGGGGGGVGDGGGPKRSIRYFSAISKIVFFSDALTDPWYRASSLNASIASLSTSPGSPKVLK